MGIQEALNKAVEDNRKLEQEIEEKDKEIEKLKTFIDEIVKTLKHCKLNGTNKLDIVAEFIEKEYDEQINGSDENEY